MAGFIAPLVGIGSSLVSGFLGSGAARKAAAAQRGAANTAADKIITTAGDVNKGISSAEVNGNGMVSSAAVNGAGQVVNAGTTAQQNVLGATGRGVDRVTGAIDQANAPLNPYMSLGAGASGTLADMLGPNGSLMKNFTADDMEANDPGYQFRLDQANKAFNRSAAAHGSALGGGTMRGLNDYSQNNASAEYQNAFNRFQSNRQQQYGMLAGAAGMGLSASAQAGQNTMQGNEYASNLDLQGNQIAGNFGVGTNEFAANMGMNAAEWQGDNSMRSAITQGNNFMNGANLWGQDMMGGANAYASGVMGSANAWSNALSGIGKTATDWASMSQMNNAPGGYPPGFQPYDSARPYSPSAPSMDPGGFPVSSLPISPFPTGIPYGAPQG